MKKEVLTQEMVRDLLHYCAESGDFTWKKRPVEMFTNEGMCKAWNTRHQGKYTGCSAKALNGKSYRQIGLFCSTYKAHRLAWLYMTGYWPTQIDHIDGNGIKISG